MLLAFICRESIIAQMPVLRGGARSDGLAGTQVMLSDPWSLACNPSGIAGIKAPTFGFGCRNYYQISDLNQFSAAIGIPASLGCFGLVHSVTGNTGLSQHHTSITYGRMLRPGLLAGIGLHYLALSQPEGYDDFHMVIPSIGFNVEIIKNLTLALSWYNPANQQYAGDGLSNIPSIFSAGAGYCLGPEVLCCFGAKYNLHGKMIYAGGFEVYLAKPICIRMGISNDQNYRFSAGLGLTLSRFSVDFSAARHQLLQYTTAVCINYSLSQASKEGNE